MSCSKFKTYIHKKDCNNCGRGAAEIGGTQDYPTKPSPRFSASDQSKLQVLCQQCCDMVHKHGVIKENGDDISVLDNLGSYIYIYI